MPKAGDLFCKEIIWVRFPAAKTAYDDSLIIEILRERYGYKAVTFDRVDKNALADIIFSDPKEMDFITSLTSVFVTRAYRKFNKKCNDLKLRVCVVESATLLTSGFCNLCNFVLVKTTESDDINIERVIKRSKIYITEDKVKSRLSNQLSNEDMLKFKDTYEIKDSLLPDQITDFVYSLL